MKISKRKDRNLYFASVLLPNGKRKKIYGKTKKEVREKADSLSFDIRSGHFVEDNKILYSDWLEQWVNGYLINVSERTKLTYRGHINNHILPAFGDTALQKLTHNMIQQFINKLNQKFKPKTVKNIYLVIHRSLKDACLNGYIAFNPADNIILPKLEKKEMQILDQNEIEEFLKVAYQMYPYYADCFEFLILTGLRIGEFIGITRDSYDPNSRTLKITKQFSGHLKKFTPPKHDVFRSIILGDRAHNIIMKRLLDTEELTIRGLNPFNLVFLNEEFRVISNITIYKKLKRIAKEIGKPDLRLHDLRHTYTTLALASGVDIKTISQNLGHSSTQFTMNKYSHSTQSMQKEGAGKIDEFLEKLTQS